MGISGKNVLIVEDDRLLSLVASRLVQKLGHNVVGTADNGFDALEKVNTQNPDVILMDIRLKGDLNGIETVERIKQHHETPVIYVSGSSYPQSRERAEKNGYEGFLLKPIQIEDLRQIFNTIFSETETSGSTSQTGIG